MRVTDQQFAKKLRRHQTDAEARLWYHLRGRRLLGFKFRRQVIIGAYIVDFVCHEARLIIELDGSQHLANKPADEMRTAWLVSRGFRVIRFWNHEVFEQMDAILEQIVATLTPSP